MACLLGAVMSQLAYIDPAVWCCHVHSSLNDWHRGAWRFRHAMHSPPRRPRVTQLSQGGSDRRRRPGLCAGRLHAASWLSESVKRVALVAERNTPVRLSFSSDQLVLEAGTGDEAQALVDDGEMSDLAEQLRAWRTALQASQCPDR